MSWEKLDRAGVFGDKTNERIQELNATYGKGNWTIRHEYKGNLLEFIDVCKLFEEAYFIDSYNRELLWSSLRKEAKDVYDLDITDIESGVDYSIQNNSATHIQDIAIRNVFKRRNWKFEGDQLIQIRSRSKPYGVKLSPGRLPFHEPENIIKPHLSGWWDENSVEDFYQSNKYLLIKK